MKKTVITTYIEGREDGTIIDIVTSNLTAFHTSCANADMIYFYNIKPIAEEILNLPTEMDREAVSSNSFKSIAGFLPVGFCEEINIDITNSIVEEGAYFDKMFYLLTKEEKEFIAKHKQHVYDVKMFNKATEKSNMYLSNSDIEKTFSNSDQVEIFYLKI